MLVKKSWNNLKDACAFSPVQADTVQDVLNTGSKQLLGAENLTLICMCNCAFRKEKYVCKALCWDCARLA